jgi:hypothetical protein
MLYHQRHTAFSSVYIVNIYLQLRFELTHCTLQLKYILFYFICLRVTLNTDAVGLEAFEFQDI